MQGAGAPPEWGFAAKLWEKHHSKEKGRSRRAGAHALAEDGVSSLWGLRLRMFLPLPCDGEDLEQFSRGQQKNGRLWGRSWVTSDPIRRSPSVCSCWSLQANRRVCGTVFQGWVEAQDKQNVMVPPSAHQPMINKQNVVHPYNGMLLSLKKERNSDTCYNTDEPWRHFAKWISQSQKCKHCVIPLIWDTGL